MSTTARRPRRSATEVERAIVTATLAELAEHGYAGVTFEGVARRAGASKPVLYRRHDSRASLVLGALRSELAEATSPSSGSLRKDLITWLDGALERGAGIGADTYRGLLGEADPAILDAVAMILTTAMGNLEDSVLAPARERGELGPALPPAQVLELPVRLLRDHIVYGTVQPDAVAVTDDILLPLLRLHTHASWARWRPDGQRARARPRR